MQEIFAQWYKHPLSEPIKYQKIQQLIQNNHSQQIPCDSAPEVSAYGDSSAKALVAVNVVLW